MKNVLKTTVFLLLLSFLSLNNGNVLASATLTLLSPNGGEVIPSGGVYLIQWEAPPDAVKFDLTYSIDGGVTWTPISNGVTDTSYLWDVLSVASNESNCLVKVTGFNSLGGIIGEDTSDITFSIVAGN